MSRPINLTAQNVDIRGDDPVAYFSDQPRCFPVGRGVISPALAKSLRGPHQYRLLTPTSLLTFTLNQQTPLLRNRNLIREVRDACTMKSHRIRFLKSNERVFTGLRRVPSGSGTETSHALLPSLADQKLITHCQR